MLLAACSDIRREVSRIAIEVLDRDLTPRKQIIAALEASSHFEQLISTIQEIRQQGASVASFSVVSRLLQLFSIN